MSTADLLRTRWFPAHIKPVRVGYYERDYGDPSDLDLLPDYWDGEIWHICDDGGVIWDSSGFPRSWRGLTKPAEGKA